MAGKRNLTNGDLEDIKTYIKLGIMEAHKENKKDCMEQFDTRYAHNGIHGPTLNGTMYDGGNACADTNDTPPLKVPANQLPIYHPKRLATTSDTYYIIFIIFQLLFSFFYMKGWIPDV